MQDLHLARRRRHEGRALHRRRGTGRRGTRRIRLRGAATGDRFREVVAFAEFFDKRVRARQVMRNGALGAHHLDHRLALEQPRPVRDALRVEHELFALDQRFGEVHRIRDRADARHHVAVADEVFRERREIALRHAVPAQPALLDMRGRDHEHVALPLAGREAHPSVRRVRRRMRAAIHVDRSFLVERADAVLDGDEIARARLSLFPDRDVGRTAIDVRRHVYPALLFRQGQPVRVPALGVPAGAVGQRQTGVVAELRTRDALAEVLLIARRPGAGQIDLRERGPSADAQRGEARADDDAPAATHGTPSGSTSNRRPPV